ncbi:MAG: sigma-70 family RNA polymerase sigma factor [Planctomycetes bacterium]|nr:sigma-70 family RNA polymerase sigma factor [Planctomycetota bacterium]
MDLEATFQQFCRTREPAALGAVFDATADDLFGLALHLTRDHAMAEDVLQATFLVAIERAHRWQPDRPLRPWLLGILHREVKVARRRVRRTPDPARVAAKPSEPPESFLLAAEVRDAVRAALGELPEPYRCVVDLHLVQALPPAAIAARLQRSSGSVRTQLWRGLDLLRQRLPQGLALGLAASVLAQSPLAAVRQRVLAGAAGTGALPVAAALVFGGLMKKFVVGPALLVAALVVVVWPAAEKAPPPSGSIGTAPAAAVVAGSLDGTPASRERVPAMEPVATPAPSPSAATTAPAPEPVAIVARVLDLRGAAIAGADVEVFVSQIQALPDGTRVAPQGRDSCVLHQTASSDVEGRVRLTLDGPALLSARKTGLGWSGDRLVHPELQASHGELLLVLQPTGKVRGRVLCADGEPAAGASVAARLLRYSVEFRGLPPVTTDAEGRFELEGLAGSRGGYDYWLMATRGTEHNRPQQVTFVAGETLELVLRFYGQFVVRGVLLDENGAPSAGKLHMQGRPGTATAEGAWSFECRADGKFEFPVDLAGGYRLVGGAAGRAPAIAAIEVDAARPAANVTLRMTTLVAVRGRVVDERGAPLAGRFVAIEPELLAQPGAGDADAAELVQRQLEMLEGGTRATSDADGRFEVRVPAGWRCRAITSAVPGHRELWSRSEPFTTPAEDVVLVVRARDAEGFVLTGRVVAEADGTPVADVEIERRFAERPSGSIDPVGRAKDGSFRLGPLAPEGRSWFVFTAEGFARTTVGPFELGVRTEELVVRLARYGRLRCRVLRKDGTPAAGAWLVLQREVEDPFAPGWQGVTDGDGWRSFDDVEPVSLRLLAWATREAGLLQVAPIEQPIVVRPGQESEVVVVLAQ